MVYVWNKQHNRYLNLRDPAQRSLNHETYYMECKRLQAEYMETLSQFWLRVEKIKVFLGCGKHQF